MKQIKITKSGYSIDFLSKFLLFLLILIIIFNFFLSFLSISTIKRQNLNHISNTINIFTDSLQKEMQAVDNFMYWSVLHEDSLTELSLVKNLESYQEALIKTRSRFNDFEKYNKVDFTFLAQSKDTGFFTNISEMQIPYSVFLYFKDYFTSENNQEIIAINTWNQITIDNEAYLYRTVIYNNKIIHSVVSVKNILKPLQEIEIGELGEISLTDPRKNNVEDERTILEAKKNDTKLPFDIYVSVDYRSAFKHMLNLQSIMILLPALIYVLSGLMLIYIQKKVIQPIKRLSNRLRQNSEEEYTLFNKEGIIEIDDANAQINNMLREMQVLRINAYEVQLKQKRIELEHLRNQIRPHFYINNLTMIHSMLQTNNYKEIEQLIMLTSKYFRYLFQSNLDFVSLQDEVEHIKHYVEIQKLRYSDLINFSLNSTVHLKEAKIPPLVLQTFIENTFKHGFSNDAELKINIKINYDDKEKLFYRIVITDNGPGFPVEILEKLNNKIPLINEDGEHIGLTNIYERLDLLYSNNYTLKIYNKYSKGAVIQLILPFSGGRGENNERIIG